MKFGCPAGARAFASSALLLLSFAGSPALAQQAALSLSSATSVPGGTVSLNISLANTGGAQTAAVEWTMGYAVSNVTSVSVAAGASLTAAGKSVTCSSNSTGTICVAYGMNTNLIADGILATATFQIAPGIAGTSLPIQMTPVSASTASGLPVTGTGTGGTITITQPVSPSLSGLACAPASVNAPGSSTCTVTLSSAAPTGGFSVALTSQNAAVTVPSTLLVPAGASTANYTATVASVTANQTVNLTAASGGVTKTFALSLVAPSQWSISGNTSALGSGATVTLSGAKSATTVADSSGNFTLTGLANGSYTITPGKAGYTFNPASQSVTVNGANVTGLTFTASQNQTISSLAADVGVWRDQSAASTTITSPTFSTKSANELLLAFISSDSNSGRNTTVSSISGASLTWALVVRTNSQRGTSEIWRAFATAVESSVSVTATLSQRVTSSMTVMSFSGVDTTGSHGSGAIGATSSNSARSGAPAAKLVTTRNKSWVFGVGNDVDRAIARTPGTGQTLIHQYLATASAATFWVQSQASPTSASGTTVTINDTAPTSDRFNLSLVEILPSLSAGGTSQANKVLTSLVPGDQTTGDQTASGFIAGALTMSNIASGLPGDSCSPGGLATLTGSGFTTQPPMSATSFPVPTELAGVQVTVNGFAAPLLMVSGSQVNFQCPVLSSGSPLAITLKAEDGSAYSLSSVMTSASPGLFRMDATGQGLVTIGTTGQIAMPTTKAVQSRPAARGEILSVFATGLGQTKDSVATGTAAPQDRLVRLDNKVKVVVGGVEIDPVFSGLAPGSVGLYQVNARLPPEVPAGVAVHMTVNVILPDGTVLESNTVTVAVGQ